MDEWVLVQFSGDRFVSVDGTVSGKTNIPFIVQRGTHIFDLGAPNDYKPASIQVQVFGTSQAKPMVLVFEVANA